LAIVSAVLAAGVVGAGGLVDRVLLGELGLDGRVRPVRGVLPATLAASQAGFRGSRLEPFLATGDPSRFWPPVIRLRPTTTI
jgi:predicted ATPase with chaperone activity